MLRMGKYFKRFVRGGELAHPNRNRCQTIGTGDVVSDEDVPISVVQEDARGVPPLFLEVLRQR